GRDEGRPLPNHPPRMLEENLWRAIRWGMNGELIDLELGCSVPARARLDALLDEVSPIAQELGIEPHLDPLRGANAAQRYVAELAIEGVRALLPVVEPLLPPDALREYRQALADLQMAYAEVVSAGGRTTPPPPSDVETPPRPKIWTPRGDI